MSLRQALDRDVYAIIKKIEETDGCALRTIGETYDAIKRSNSSLSRQKKRPLEDAIDRVLEFRRRELDESDSEAEIEDNIPKPADDRFLLNRQMTKLWKDDTATDSGKSDKRNGTDDRPAKKRRIQKDQEGTGRGAESDTAAKEANGATAAAKEKTSAPKPPKATPFSVESGFASPELGGVDVAMRQIKMHLPHFLKPEMYDWDPSLRPVSGIVLTGPTGIGKDSLARKLAAEIDVPLITLDGCFEEPDRMKKALSAAFDEAMRLAPSIVYLRTLEDHMAKPSSQTSGAEVRRGLREFEAQMRRLKKEQPQDKPVLAIATTSAIGEVDPRALVPGLFQETVHLKLPDLAAREQILRILLQGQHLADDVDFAELSRTTHGYIASDLVKFCARTRSIGYERVALDENVPMIGDIGDIIDQAQSTLPREVSNPVLLSMNDFKLVGKEFVPALREEGFTAIPEVQWDQVGALEAARKSLQSLIVGPIRHPELYLDAGLTIPAGVLLWGPPGCGKTLIAQAVANEAQASFILINGPELLNKYVGESERAVRELFQRARSSTPCILFFDEIDSIVPRRDRGGSEASTRVVNALLTELDGVKDRAGVSVIGTTNRPDMIDEAMLRPGRLSDRIFLDLPTEDERVDILSTIYRSRRRLKAISEADAAALESVARDARCKNYSGADLSGLQQKAAHHCLQRYFAGTNPGVTTNAEDWNFALDNTAASVPRPEIYRKLAAK